MYTRHTSIIARLLLACLLAVLYGSCTKQSVHTVRYTAYDLIYNPSTLKWETVIIHMLEIGRDGHYALARESEGGYTYFKGVVPDSLQALVQLALAGEQYAFNYPYDAARGYYTWDGLNYLLDYGVTGQRNIVGFIPPEAPAKIRRLSRALDSFVASPALRKADGVVLSGYETEARRLIIRLEKEPLPEVRWEEFAPAPIR